MLDSEHFRRSIAGQKLRKVIVKITANQIAAWSANSHAQGELPRLVRNLIHTTATVTAIAVPAGDSIVQPGFDGRVCSTNGNAWVPTGPSVWEMSCRTDVGTKANEDYDKRTSQIPAIDRNSMAYVAVTARKWTGKDRWVQDREKLGEWREVRAYDADDLEQWLEQSPSVSLRLAEQLGLAGPGVESLEAYWSKWSSQSSPAVTPDAIVLGRTDAMKQLLESFQKQFEKQSSEVFAVKADSAEEAVAFVCACGSINRDILANSVVVTNEAGWRYVDANEAIKIAVSAWPEFAERPSVRVGLTVVIPYACGDMSGHFKGTAGGTDSNKIRIDRPDHSEFDRALVQLGLDSNDARRFSSLSGRSWTVFRRIRAINPAIRRPQWLEAPASRALSTVCLVSGWSDQQDEDRKVVERISGNAYSSIERDLTELEKLDDSPVVRIGRVWKAKSPLELLSLFGDRITSDELDRFFVCTEELLSAPDPQLELPDSKRHAASIFGKGRPISGFLLESLADTLVKLAVRGPDVPALRAVHIEQRISMLVSKLLENAEPSRWLSLHGILPLLAEAAPLAFMQAIEKSLVRDDAPVRSMLLETSGAGIFGRCWHAGLLWALEMLAWAPERLGRVCLILAALTETKISGNWGNSPENTLVAIFRSWFPQTSATIDQRIAVLDKLIKDKPEPAYELLNRLTHVGHDVASNTHRPCWRDDDAGAGQGATNNERYLMLVAAADRQIQMAAGRADRIVKLIDKLGDFDECRAAKVLDLVKQFNGSGTSDRDKTKIRDALRQKIHWYRNYGDESDELSSRIVKYESAYDGLAPANPIWKHGWLFASSWVDLPIRDQEERVSGRQDALRKWRQAALQEIFYELAWDGIVELSVEFSAGLQVGFALPTLNLDKNDIVDWVAKCGGELERNDQRTAIIQGYLRAIDENSSVDILKNILTSTRTTSLALYTVRLLVLAPENPSTWALAADLGETIENDYWLNCFGNIWLQDDRDGYIRAIERLIEAKRPRTALKAAAFELKTIDSDILARMLEAFLRGEEEEAPLPEGYWIQEAIKRIEAEGTVARDRLLQIEFGLFRVLGHRGEKQAVTLFRSVMSDPQLFFDLLALVYKPRNSTSSQEVSEESKFAAENAWHILHDCSVQPGIDLDGQLRPANFTNFIEKVRELAKDGDRVVVCDLTIGEIIARGPVGEDGIFPFEPARELLDRPELEDMRRGFHVGCFNKRGVVTRAPLEGGDQERELSEYYKRQANGLRDRYPFTAATLDGLAKTYEDDGLRHDLDARLRREER